MADGLTVTIKGDKKLIQELKAVGVDVQRALDDALKSGAKPIQQVANSKAPGPHIAVSDPQIKGDSGEIKVGPDDNHWYYKFLEYGAGAHTIPGSILVLFGTDFVTGSVPHPGFAARPFLRPALDENKSQAERRMGDELRKAIERGRAS